MSVQCLERQDKNVLHMHAWEQAQAFTSQLPFTSYDGEMPADSTLLGTLLKNEILFFFKKNMLI